MDLGERPSDPAPRKIFAATAAFAFAATGIAVAVWAFLGGTTPGSEGLRPNGPIVFLGTGTNSGLGVDNMEIYAVAPEGGTTLNLTNSPAEEREPAWSREGRAVVFTRSSFEEAEPGSLSAHRGIFLADGGGARELIECGSAGCKEQGVALSPDGTKIAFIRSGAVEVTDATDGLTTQICAEPDCGQSLAEVAWSPDGSRIAFAESAPRHGIGLYPSAVLVADLSADSFRRITNTDCFPGHRKGKCSFDTSPEWSPDGTMIAFARTTGELNPQHSISVMRSDGRDIKQVAKCKWSCGFVWSPDGRQIALIEYSEPTIRLVHVSSGDETILGACRSEPCSDPFELAWSPDGRKIAFLAGAARTVELYVTGTDGRETQRINTGGTAHCCLAWLPESAAVNSLMSSARATVLPARRVPAPATPPPGLLVFTGNPSELAQNEDENEIYSARADGTHLTQLTNDPTFRISNLYPSWSPDGSRIHFYRQSFGDFPSEKFAMNLDGTEQQPLKLPDDSAISPDETKVAFAESDGDGTLFVMSMDGSARRAITGPGVYQRHSTLVWSPNGSRILFEGQTNDGTDLFIVDGDGGEPRTVTDFPGGEAGADWSPDGSQIVFDWWTPAGSDLYVINSDGTRLKRLTDFGGGIGSPSWSPDGSTIAFYGENLLESHKAHSGIYTIGVDGSGLFQVTPSGSITFFDPAWQPAP